MEIELARDKNVETVCRGLGISPQTSYRWRKTYGRMGVDQAERLEALEKENVRLEGAVYSPLRQNRKFRGLRNRMEQELGRLQDRVRRMNIDLYPPGAEPDAV